MARYRKVDPRMWRADAKVRALSNNAKLLWCYLLTGPETTSLPGVIPLVRASLCEYFAWSVPHFMEVFSELESRGMALADWEAGLVFLPNALGHNHPANPNVVKGWATIWAETPECALKDRIRQTFLNGLRNGFETVSQTVFETVCGMELYNPVPVHVLAPEEGGMGGEENQPDLPVDLGPTWAEALAREWMAALPFYEKHPEDVDRHLPRWVAELEKLERLDKHPVENIERLVRWVYQDDSGDRSAGQWPGWKWNCQTPAKLRQRQKSTDRKYFDVIWEQMERGQGSRKKRFGEVSRDPKDWREEW